ncbi:hypothetical protein KAR48_14805 [bacterium]|nr:hypothetical protein [bacterium]
MKTAIICIIFMIIGTAFSQQKTDWKNLPVEIKEPVQILDSDDEESDAMYIGRCVNITWNNSDRHLYVSDVLNHQIHLYNKDLERVKSLGRMGQGPGEFQYPVGCGFSSSNQLVVIERKNSRLQIMDTNGQCIKIFPVLQVYGYRNFALVDHRDRIYINLAENGHLFSVFNMKGERLGSFGETISISGIPEKDRWLNVADFAIDSTGIYCVFNEFPLFRKYNHDWQLVYEVDLSDCPDVIRRQKAVRVFQKTTNGRSLHIFTLGVSLDSKFCYLNLQSCSTRNDDGRTNVYATDKNTGEIVKQIQLKTPRQVYPNMCYYPDFSDEKYIFALSINNCSLLKYHK